MSQDRKIYNMIFSIIICALYCLFAVNIVSSNSIHPIKESMLFVIWANCLYLLVSNNSSWKTRLYLILASICIGYFYIREYMIFGDLMGYQALLLGSFAIIFLIPPFDMLSTLEQENKSHFIEIFMQYIFVYCAFLNITQTYLCEFFSYIVLFFCTLRALYHGSDLTALLVAKIYLAFLLLLCNRLLDLGIFNLVFCSLFFINILYKVTTENTKNMIVKNISYVVTGIAPLCFLHELIEPYIFCIYLLMLHIFVPRLRNVSNFLHSAKESCARIFRKFSNVRINRKPIEINIERYNFNLSFAIALIFLILGFILLF